MSGVLSSGTGPVRMAGWQDRLPWALLVMGLLVMYVPTFVRLAEVFWRNERGTTGPLVMTIFAWLAWRHRSALVRATAMSRDQVAGALIFVLGLVAYAIGRSQEFHQAEVGSLIPVLGGMLLALRGRAALRAFAFPLLFLSFVVPVPGSMLDAVLVPLKEIVSHVAELVLHIAGYPVARSGVVLTIGQYQLLIADACSGLNSMVALTGIGLLYVHIAGHASKFHNLLLVAAILPIAFLANLVRVLLLMLVTFHFGDAAGRNFHDHAGYLEIAMAFGTFFAFDWLLLGGARLLRRLTGRRTAMISEAA